MKDNFNNLDGFMDKVCLGIFFLSPIILIIMIINILGLIFLKYFLVFSTFIFCSWIVGHTINYYENKRKNG